MNALHMKANYFKQKCAMTGIIVVIWNVGFVFLFP